ncbi:hypothetical protein EGH25_04345 [Haladaptatus sp. F3-133]|jgi:hypothetical protein|uniref:Uncharacterized protein n=1 Tax=Halorutilus salinus TaxID=2487751 RepID=A0A9Q4C3T9_9EURY|nr:hypothetical protein [Halorutilus salinus]MCX2818582.1 hypothetical protein [Halorutilus salinus]
MTGKEKRKEDLSPEEVREMDPDERMEYVTWMTKEESDDLLDEVEEAVNSEDSFEPYDPTADLDGGNR